MDETAHRPVVAWLSATPLVDPTAMHRPDDALFVCLHDDAEVRAWRASGRPATVVVAETEPAPAFGFDPARMLSLLLAGSTEPRYLVAVRKPGLSSPDSQEAFAAEMHRLCGRYAILLVQHAVVDETSSGLASAKAGKHEVLTQRYRWVEVAEIAAGLATRSFLGIQPGTVSPGPERFVGAMLGDRKPALSKTDKQILVAIASMRATSDPRRLAKVLHLQPDTVSRRLREIAEAVRPPGDPSRGRDDESVQAFCAGLALRYGPWLTSYSERSRLFQPLRRARPQPR